MMSTLKGNSTLQVTIAGQRCIKLTDFITVHLFFLSLGYTKNGENRGALIRYISVFEIPLRLSLSKCDGKCFSAWLLFLSIGYLLT